MKCKKDDRKNQIKLFIIFQNLMMYLRAIIKIAKLNY